MAKAKPIFIVGTNKVYPSVVAAAKDLGIHESGISKVLSGARPHAGGYRFGYVSDRVIYVPETGQTFSNSVQASRKLGVKNKKLESVLQSGADRTVGGYHVVYESSAALSRSSAQAQSQTTATRSAGRKANKQSRIEQKRQKKAQKRQQQQQKEQQRRKERAASAAMQQQREKERQQRRQRSQAIERTKELKEVLAALNNQLKKYQDAYMMGYSKAAQDVAEFQNYLGGTKEGLFDISDANMQTIADTMTDEEIAIWIEQINAEISDKKGLFWNLKKQIQERQEYAMEFGVGVAEIDKYIDLLPELWLVLAEASRKQRGGSKLDGTWDEIMGAVQGGVSHDALKKTIDQLRDYWTGKRTMQLSDILNQLHSKYKPRINLFDIDDNNLPF